VARIGKIPLIAENASQTPGGAAFLLPHCPRRMYYTPSKGGIEIRNGQSHLVAELRS